MTASAMPGAREPEATAARPAGFRMGGSAPWPGRGKQRRAMRGNASGADSGRCGAAAGFTLLEILVVTVILGLVAPAALRQLGGAKISIAHQSIERLSSVLELYRLDAGNDPSTQQGLQALLTAPAGASRRNGPDLKGTGVAVDPWDHPFVYRAPSTRRGDDDDLCSTGPNARKNDTAQDGWICN